MKLLGLFLVMLAPQALGAYMSHSIFASWNPYSTSGGQVRYSTIVNVQCDEVYTMYKLKHRGEILFSVWQPRVSSDQETHNKPANCPGSQNWGHVDTLTAHSVPCGCYNNRNNNVSDTAFYIGSTRAKDEQTSGEKFITRECEQGGGGS